MTSWLFQQVKAHERRLIDEALRVAGGHHGKAAKALGIKPDDLNKKLSRARKRYPDPSWDDPPLAWAIRRDRDRVLLAPCWTREEIRADAESAETIALVVDHGAAKLLASTMNTTMAVRAAAVTRQRAAESLSVG